MIARSLFPNAEGDDYFSVGGDYETIYRVFGTPVVEVSCRDYSGDTYLLYHGGPGSKFGFLVFGWGSCSGCDALQGCTSYEEVDQLIMDLSCDIVWLDTVAEMKTYLMERDKAGDWYRCTDTFYSFRKLALEYLENHGREKS